MSEPNFKARAVSIAQILQSHDEYAAVSRASLKEAQEQLEKWAAEDDKQNAAPIHALAKQLSLMTDARDAFASKLAILRMGPARLSDMAAVDAYGRTPTDASPSDHAKDCGDVAAAQLAKIRARLTEDVVASAINAAAGSSEPAVYGPLSALLVLQKALFEDP